MQGANYVTWQIAGHTSPLYLPRHTPLPLGAWCNFWMTLTNRLRPTKVQFHKSTYFLAVETKPEPNEGSRRRKIVEGRGWTGEPVYSLPAGATDITYTILVPMIAVSYMRARLKWWIVLGGAISSTVVVYRVLAMKNVQLVFTRTIRTGTNLVRARTGLVRARTSLVRARKTALRILFGYFIYPRTKK